MCDAIGSEIFNHLSANSLKIKFYENLGLDETFDIIILPL